MPDVGSTWSLTGDGIGVGIGAVPAGSQVSVLDVVPTGTPGVGDIGEDTVLVGYDETTTVLDDSGNPVTGEVPRVIAVSATDFSRLFQGA